MPNGDPHFSAQELPSLEEFFSGVSDVLTKFAEDFNLKIDQYWHQMPSWRFSFRHPKGGVACLEVMKESATDIKIYSYWWIDDFERATRYSRSTETKVFRLGDVELRNLLQDALTLLLSWPLNAWTEITTGYAQAWSCYTREDFSKFESAYPLPKV